MDPFKAMHRPPCAKQILVIQYLKKHYKGLFDTYKQVQEKQLAAASK